MNKLVKTAALLVLLSLRCSAQLFWPSVELTGTYTKTTDYANIQDGKFDLNNRKVNFGGAVFNQFKINRCFAISIGLRYQSYKFVLFGLNQLETKQGKPSPFTWTRKYGSLSVPILAGFNFYSHKGRRINVTGGASWGIYFGNYARTDLMSSINKDMYSEDTSEASMWGTSDLKKPQRIFSLEASASIQPFQKLPQLMVGIFASMQTTKVDFEHFNARDENKNLQAVYNYQADYAQKYTNFGVKVVYDFKARKAMKKTDTQRCVTF